MKTKLPILLCCMFFIINAYAQKPKTISYPTEQKIFWEYTVKIIPSAGKTFGYDIFKGKVLVVHQPQNIFLPIPDGLRRKEDVFKVAEWVVSELKRTGVAPRQAPMQLAEELEILLPGQPDNTNQ